jgi:hypothetical protein
MHRLRGEARRDQSYRILKEEEEKRRNSKRLSILTDRLSSINETWLGRSRKARNEYDRTIQGRRGGIQQKILESSQTLLQV